MYDFFDLKNNGTRVVTEIAAGTTTFLAAMYICLINPAILNQAGLPYDAVLTSTVLVSAFSSILMGFYSNNPLLVAPGMSLNHLFVAAVVRSETMTYQTALGCVFWAGIAFLLLLILDRNHRLLTGVPRMLRFGMAGGIGLFIAFLGFQAAGFIIIEEPGRLAMGYLDATTLTFLAGLAFTAALVARKVPCAFIMGVLVTTLLAWPIGRFWGQGTGDVETVSPLVVWQGWWAWPDLGLILEMDLLSPLMPVHWPFIFVLVFSCFFDSFSTCAGVGEAGDLVDEKGEPRDLERSMKVNAIGVALSGFFGVSPATVYVESSTGVRSGGRTGLTAVVAGLLFLPFLFMSPLLYLVPALATAPVMVLAGIFMLKPLIYVRWERFDEAAPFFMAMITMPLTGSITQGAIWGILSWIVVKASCGKFRQIPRVLLLLGLAALVLLFQSGPFRH
ncbi:MAG: NCS2 family permease [Desulfonatronovibrio sp.]